jgi:hypothetical protein
MLDLLGLSALIGSEINKDGGINSMRLKSDLGDGVEFSP